MPSPLKSPTATAPGKGLFVTFWAVMVIAGLVVEVKPLRLTSVKFEATSVSAFTADSKEVRAVVLFLPAAREAAEELARHRVRQSNRAVAAPPGQELAVGRERRRLHAGGRVRVGQDAQPLAVIGEFVRMAGGTGQPYPWLVRRLPSFQRSLVIDSWESS